MRTSGFGRRVLDTSGRDLVVVALAHEEPSFVPDHSGYTELKEHIRVALMSRVDPSVASRMPRPTLQADVAKLVNEIATEERIHLNELEESRLAVELTDDMIGLGPLEPFFEDDRVTDVLANGPFDIYVERGGKLERTRARFRDSQHLAN